MHNSIPRAEDYGISPQRGFLPAEDPLQCLPHPIYRPWEALVAKLPSLIQTRKIRYVVDRLEVIPLEYLQTIPELRRAYSLLGFIVNAYIWSGDKPAAVVPPPISIPFKALSEQLELPTSATYAGLVLWNFKVIKAEIEVDVLENLSTLNTFTGLQDESWFFLISVAIEKRGGPMIPILLEAMEAVLQTDTDRVITALQASALCLDDLRSLLTRMYEGCDPHIFYNQIRRFFAGSADVQHSQSNGVVFEDGSAGAKLTRHRGSSNAQSSLFQFLDIVFGVEHDNAAPGTITYERRSNFLHSMRAYMPGPHRRFLEDVATAANLRDFVHARASDEILVAAFNKCVEALIGVRRTHIQIVTRYIVLQGSNGGDGAHLRDKTAQRGTSSALAQNASRRGTGGTMLIPFLKQTMQETRKAAVDVQVDLIRDDGSVIRV